MTGERLRALGVGLLLVGLAYAAPLAVLITAARS